MRLFRKKSKDFASIEFCDDRVFVLSLFDNIKGGPLTICPPFDVCENDFSSISLSLLRSLNADKSSNRNRSYEDLITEFLTFSGFKTIRSFEKVSKKLLVEKDGNKFTIIPTVKGKNGFEELLENQFRTTNVNEIESLLQRAFTFCE